MKKMKWLAPAFALVVGASALFASHVPALFAQEGQRRKGTEKAPGGCFICGNMQGMHTGLFEASDWFGTLAWDACPIKKYADDHPLELERDCQKLKAQLKITSFKFACPSLAPYCEPETKEPKKKPCENPSTDENPPPWFDTPSCELKEVDPWVAPQTVDEEGNLLPPGQVWCVASYLFCGEFSGPPQTIRVIKKVTIDPAAWNSNNSAVSTEASMKACQSFIDQHKNAPKRRICCDTWANAADRPPSPGSCEAISDPDCDGIPNYKDPFPFHPRPTDYTSQSPLTGFPFWKDFKNALPDELCECQWEFIDARYKCSDVRVHNSATRGSSNQAKYDYQVKWKCQATGREIVTTREVTMPGLFCPRGRQNN